MYLERWNLDEELEVLFLLNIVVRNKSDVKPGFSETQEGDDKI